MLHLHQFEKYYGAHLALRVADLTVPEGIHWVQGGNGSGKTTFFKTLAGLLPFAGTITWRQQLNLRTQPVDFRRVVSLGEAEPLYPPFLTGQDLLTFYARCRRADAAQVRTLAEALGVSAFADRPVGTYSSGMAKKLSLVLALVGHPQLVLLDEPLITLDVATVPVMCQLIDEHRQRGVSFLISSHQAFETGTLPFDTQLLVVDQTIRPLSAPLPLPIPVRP